MLFNCRSKICAFGEEMKTACGGGQIAIERAFAILLRIKLLLLPGDDKTKGLPANPAQDGLGPWG